MPVEFLSDDQASAYGSFLGEGFSRAELEQYFFLDDVDRGLIEPKRRDHNKLGFAVQLSTVRYAGRFHCSAVHVDIHCAETLDDFGHILKEQGNRTVLATPGGPLWSCSAASTPRHPRADRR